MSPRPLAPGGERGVAVITPAAGGVRRWLVAFALFLIAIAGVTVAPRAVDTALAQGSGTWTTVASPNLGTSVDNTLTAATCVTASDCWAVGYYGNGSPQTAMAIHWDGATWSPSSVPSPGADARLTSVACASSNACYAAGYSCPTTSCSATNATTLIETWNGSTWSRAATPNINAHDNAISGVTCAAANNCVAVGYYCQTVATPGCASGTEQTLALTWNGSAWSLSSAVDATPTTNRLNAVSCATTTSCIAVGTFAGSSALQNLVESYNGSTWTVGTISNLSANNDQELLGVSCPLTSYCMATGYGGTSSSTTSDTAYAYDGATWAQITAPTHGGGTSERLGGVTCDAASVCWAAGAYCTANCGGSESDQAFVAVFSGATTSLTAISAASTSTANDVGCEPPGVGKVCWAVGSFGTGGGSLQTLATEFDPTPVTMTLTSSSNPATVGQVVTYTASLAASAPQATGDITFYESGTAIPACTHVTVTSDTATCQRTYSAATSFPVSANYFGDATYAAASASLSSNEVIQTGAAVATVATPTSTANPSVYGQTTTFSAAVSGSGATPTGYISFYANGTTLLGTVALNGSGIGSLATSVLSAGNTPITASYSGDGTYAVASSSALTQTVAKGTVTLSISSSNNPALTTQNVSYTVTVTPVAPSTGAPTGTATFYDNGIPITFCAVAVSGNTATCGPKTYATTGTHPITVGYSADSNYADASSSALTETVNPWPTTANLTSGSNPSSAGSVVNYVATVATAGGPTPTGTVSFFVDGSDADDVALSGGTATYSASLAKGTHSLYVAYFGSATMQSSTSSATPLTQTVTPLVATIATPTSSANPSVYGQPLTFTTRVTGSGTQPTGSVTFMEGATVVGSATLDGSGYGSFTTSASLGVGTHVITAVYGGDSLYANGTSGSLTQVVNPDSSTTTVSASPPSGIVVGESVTYTSTITVGAPGTATPSGTVTFLDNGSAISGCASQPVVSGTATCVTSYSVPGTHTIGAAYNGDPDVAASVAFTTDESVSQADTTTALSSSTNPSVTGQSVTFTASVSVNAPGLGSPTGSVTFNVNGTPSAPMTLSGGMATYTTSAFAIQGANAIAAVYSGDTSFATSSGALTQTQNAADTSTLLSGPSSAVTGESISFVSTTTVTSPGTGTPAGTVTFFDGASPIATCVSLATSGGTATCTASWGTPESASITAQFTPSGNSYNGSTSAALGVGIGPSATATVVTSSPSSSVALGGTVVYTATVSRQAPGSGTPTGHVTFFDGGATISGCATLTGPAPTCTQTYTTAGARTITASYAGSANDAASTSSPFTETVMLGTPSVATVSSSANPSSYGTAVTFTTSVSGAGVTPTGTVAFYDGATSLGTATLTGGTASFTTTATALSVGSHSITAHYGGDSSYTTGISGALGQQVTQATSSVSTPSAAPDPSTYGSPATVSVVVSGPAGVPTGTVTFYVNGSPAATKAVAPDGTASFVESVLDPGVYTIRAIYSGDGNYLGATSADADTTVVKASPTVPAPSATPNPAVVAASVVISTTVPSNAAGNTPTGTVTFTADGTTTLAVITLDAGGTATTTVSTLPVGSHSITASYSGDIDYESGSSAPVSLEIDTATPSLSVGSVTNPTTVGGTATFVATLSGSAGTPTGTVTFSEGGTTLGTGTINGSGIATFSLTTLPAGTHTIVATYSGDANYAAATGSVNQEVDVAAPSLAAPTSSQNPSTYASAVTFTATVSGAGAGPTPSGHVTFEADGVAISGCSNKSLTVVTISTLTATCTTSQLSPGTPAIDFAYSGDSNYSAGTSAATGQTVTAGPTTTALSAAPNPATYGSTVTLTANVSAALTVSGGTVKFFDGATQIGSGVVSAGTVSMTTALLTAGTHGLTASYAGTSLWAPSTASTTLETINQSTPTVGVASSANPAPWGQSVTFTATLSGTGGSATGSVTWKDGATVLGISSLTSGSATYTPSTLTVGSHSITAIYSGDTNVASATGALTQVVTLEPTTTVAGASPFGAIVGTPVTLTATVSAAVGTPGGTVTFSDGATLLGTATLSGGVATLTTSTLAVGSHSITAAYGGASVFDASASSPASETIGRATPVVGVPTSSNNPSIYGQSVTLTSTVSGGFGTLAANVKFLDGTTLLGTVAPSGGTASLTLSTLGAGTHAITATYVGDTNNKPVTSGALSQTVQQASTSLAAPVITPSPSVYASAVTITAALSTSGPSPSGTVTFTSNGSTIGSAPLAGTTATLVTSALPGGTNVIGATYSGDANFAGSISATTTTEVIVRAAPTVSTPVSSGNPVLAGTSVTFTIQVTGPGVTPTGSVSFLDGATSIGTAVLTSGTATFSVVLNAGTHAIRAHYAGDSNYVAATSTALSQVITMATSTTTAPSANPNPVNAGQTVTIAAHVDGTGPVPTGSVTLFDGITAVASTALGSSGDVTFSTAGLGAGSHSLVAHYSGDINTGASTSAATTLVVVRNDSATSDVALTPATTSFGNGVTLTVNVSGAVGVPHGGVTFFDGATALGSVTLDATASASLTVTPGAGAHDYTASYAGSAVYKPSASADSSTASVASAPTTTTFTATSGATTTIVITVASGAGAPPGSVVIVDNGTPEATVSLSNGTATWSAATATLPIGTNEFAGTFSSASDNYSGSAASPVDVNVAPPATASPTPPATTTTAGPVTISFTPPGSTTAPPGAASAALISSLHSKNPGVFLTGADIPLVGAHTTSLPASVYDTAAVPQIGTLAGIGAPSFGNPIIISWVLLIITACSGLGIVIERRRWLRFERAAAAVNPGTNSGSRPQLA